MNCPHCGGRLLSPEAQVELDYARTAAAARGGYIWEGARPGFEDGSYPDKTLSELIAVGALVVHPDPTKGYIVKW